MSIPVIRAIVLGGGESKRMGTQKLALPLGSKTVLQRIIHELSCSRVDSILVVLGPSSGSLAADLHGPTEVLRLDRQTSDMRATFEAGLNHLETMFRPTPADALLVCLADQPTIRRDNIDRLIDAYQSDPSQMFVPVYNARRGHPVVIPWRNAVQIRTLPPGTGLNVILRDEHEPAVEIPLDDPDILFDLDEPMDFERLRLRDWD